MELQHAFSRHGHVSLYRSKTESQHIVTANTDTQVRFNRLRANFSYPSAVHQHVLLHVVDAAFCFEYFVTAFENIASDILAFLQGDALIRAPMLLASQSADCQISLLLKNIAN